MSRTPAQLLSVRVRRSELGLRVQRPGDAGKLRVKNDLGARLSLLVARAADGQHYWGRNVAPGATAVLQRVEPATFVAVLRREYFQALPQESAEVAQHLRGGARAFRYRPFATNAEQETSLLERVMRLLDDTATLWPGSYMAIADRSPEVELGVSEAEEVAPFHVIAGQW